MKKLYKILVLSFLSLALLPSCNSYLDQDPYDDTMTQDQFDKLGDAWAAAMRGVYSMMYQSGGREHHDIFGQRSIDMYGDLLCGDMALTSETYGWFSTDEYQHTPTARNSYIWSYNYNMLRNINKVIYSIQTKTELLQHVKQYGLPNDGLKVVDSEGNVVYHYGEKDSLAANYYAQALTMRGYVYSNLLKFFTPTVDHIFAIGRNLTNYPAFPVYTENNFDDGAQGMASINKVYEIATDSSLILAIKYFEAFGKDYIPTSKLIANENTARGLLAYFNLNRAKETEDKDHPLLKEPMEAALANALAVINSGEYSIIPNADVLTNGFNNIDDKSWIWGQKVTIETATGLASFFGQVDIHSYSYAWSGDGKAIDKRLYDSIPTWDIRKQWFNDGSTRPTFALCPDKKFFSAKSPHSTSANDIDREWQSDNVFMRIESMYLIAAEACYFLGSQDSAVMFLTAITDQRINTEDPNAATNYATFKATLSNPDKFVQELIRNWRVEMWGEGYGLQTFRRLTTHKYKVPNAETGIDDEKIRRGSNHLYNPGAEMSYDDETIYTLPIPASETNYNPFMK